MKSLSYFFAGVLLILVSCGPKVTSSTSSSSAGRYNEDLSVWRPKAEAVDTVKSNGTSTVKDSGKDRQRYVEPKFAVNESLDAVLDSISEVNLANGVVDGYTIQIYSGLKREEALNIKKEIAAALPDLDAQIQYVQPNFRVRAGKYFDRYEAQKDYMTIKKHFPNAIVIPERIPIN
jgi:hypothetical protein